MACLFLFMLINYNSQLGLRFQEKSIKVKFLQLRISTFEKTMNYAKSEMDRLEGLKESVQTRLGKSYNDATYNDLTEEEKQSYDLSIGRTINCSDTRLADVLKFFPDNVTEYLITYEDSKYFYICESVYKCADLIKIGENFSGRTMKDIDFGKYTYLIGKNEMIRFQVEIGAIIGFYYNEKDNYFFDWGIILESGDYYVENEYINKFSEIMKILTFVELGDIEVKILKGGQNNGGRKNISKITNNTKNTVYIVDSTWNQILMRTDGFAVRGHFRLQPYGEGMKDRKLIWIDAFEKHGYTRKPKGQIIHE